MPEGGNQTIQQAVNNASEYDMIIVRDGTYNENVNVNVAHLTIRSENDSAVTTVTASNPNDHVFDVSKDYVNISGFTATGATGGGKAGIYLGSNVGHCNVSDNTASNNYFGIYLYSSSNNNSLTNNTANSNKWHGIYLVSSSYNNLTNNTANSNNEYGIRLSSSSNNNLTNNTAYNNTQRGIYLYDHSNYNILTNNNAYNNTWEGIYLRSSSNNTLMENTANSNYCGIYLYSSSNNNVSCNWVQNNSGYGFYLYYGSTGNTIERNNIVMNGVSQGDGSYHWQFYNDQSNDVEAKNNWWGTDVPSEIAASIREDTGNVSYEPFLDSPSPCAPGYRQPAPIQVPAFSAIGLLALIGILSVVLAVATKRRKG